MMCPISLVPAAHFKARFFKVIFDNVDFVSSIPKCYDCPHCSMVQKSGTIQLMSVLSSGSCDTQRHNPATASGDRNA